MKRIFYRTALFILRKHWIRSQIKVSGVVYRDHNHQTLRPEFPVKKVFRNRDFDELYFFPRIAAKLFSKISLQIDVNVVEVPNPFGDGMIPVNKPEKMYFQRPQ